VFENGLVRKILGHQRDGVRGECVRLYTDKLQDLYCSSNKSRVIKSRRMKREGNVARMGKTRGEYRGLVVKPEVKRQLGRPRHRWEDTIV
jgi:hypothetical protein